MAVARHLHFGRAAAELHIAQPVLSRQIRALEDELHVTLFRRDRRSTELTDAGRQLLSDAVPLLAAADALRRRVARADHFTVGFMPGLIVTDAVRAICDRHPGLTVDLMRTGWNDQTEVIRDGRADVSYVRLPVDKRGLTLRPLFGEPRVAMLPATHRLAGKETIEIAELADDHLLQDPAAVPEWHDIATTVPPADPPAYAVEEKLEHVAAGRGIVVLPLSTARFYTRPDVHWARITDIPPNRVSLAWDATRRDPLLTEFAAVAEQFPAA